MELIVKKNYEEMSKEAARIFAAQIRLEPEIVIGLATGSTPIAMYKELIKEQEERELDFSNVVSFNLDEYLDIDPSHPQSFRSFMYENLFNELDLADENIFIPSATSENATEYAEMYEGLIDAFGGIDLQLLGIGHNGHIGFNEPADHFVKDTNIVNLSQDTIENNARFFNSEAEVPKKAITVGIGAIMKAKKVVLIASGKDKAEILLKAIAGPVCPEVPASILQFHPNCTFIIDEAAFTSLAPLFEEEEEEV